MSEIRSDRVRITLDDHGVAEVALARADKLNALDGAMFDAINAAIEQLQGERKLRAVLLHGEGRAFCAGLDMGRFASMADPVDGQAEGRDLATRTHGLANAFQHVAWGWRELPVPVIAALHGVAFGGGLQIALGADIRLVAPDTKLSVMEIKWGLVPDMAGFALMAGLVRADAMRELVYTGRIVSGDEAVALGLATRACADPLAQARALARQVATQSPQAIRGAKRLCQLSVHAEPAAMLLAEAREQQLLLGSPQQREAVRAGLAGCTPQFED